jgi:ferric-dicitrate binding protein FerR (iron transport regulator)
MTKVDEKTLSVAAQWCACLRDPKGTTTAVERWLAWAEADELNLEAFEHIAELGNRLGRLDDSTRQQWAIEFARRSPSSCRLIRFAIAVTLLLALLGSYLCLGPLFDKSGIAHAATHLHVGRDL